MKLGKHWTALFFACLMDWFSNVKKSPLAIFYWQSMKSTDVFKDGKVTYAHDIAKCWRAKLNKKFLEVVLEMVTGAIVWASH